MAEKKSQIGRRKRLVSRARKVADAYVSKQDTAPKLTPIPEVIDQLRIDLQFDERSSRKLTQAADQERKKRGEQTKEDVLKEAEELALVGTPKHERVSKILRRGNVRVGRRRIETILKEHADVLEHRIKQHHPRR